MRIAVAQLGARMHYAVPKVLERAGRLEHLYTDANAGQGWPRWVTPLAGLPGATALKRFLGRVPEGVPQSKITAYNAFGIDYARRRAKARTAEAQAEVFLWSGREFCRRLVREGLGEASHTFTYNSAGLEWMRHAHTRGLKTIMEQTIAPKAFELRLLAGEQARFPGWEAPQPPEATGLLKEYCDREAAEWAEADLILCGSPFVMDGVAACGGPVERCAVVPYGVDGGEPLQRRTSGDAAKRPLRVLTVGAVGLRKGSPTVLETAELTQDRCQFRMVGPLTASEKSLAALSKRVELLGPVPRSSIREHYAWADVFFLPSVCEGSATVVYEALATGLPVLTTPNAGSVVTPGLDGWIEAVGDAAAMAKQLLWIDGHRDTLPGYSQRALETARHYDTASYGQRLLQRLDPA